ncbi:MAG: hypothetical protein WD448_12530 [Woeseia sp.]
MKNLTCSIIFVLFALNAGCDSQRTATVDAAPTAADRFLQRIAGHCGEAFAGRVVADQPEAAENPFAGRELIMHVRDCNSSELRIPFHVGEDRSRTWILTRTAEGVRLRHDHRHQDGSEDVLTMYGGNTADAGDDSRQEFPVDRQSVELFRREGLEASVINVWAMEIEPGKRFVYELARPGTERLFRVEFDLSEPVATPPPVW